MTNSRTCKKGGEASYSLWVLMSPTTTTGNNSL